MKEYIFIYGTLLPEYAPDEIAGIVRQLRRVGSGCVRGRLYDLGNYPGVILDASSRTKVRGHLFALPDGKRVLRALDSYEDFKPDDVKNSLFVRKRTTATLDDGRKVECWVYVYNRDPSSAPLVSGGDYAKIEAA
ncbi:MAG TPA: gamma-glutamylcyclotransferase family protein [Pyrinomonadaceae bacterium]|nr:gamma-glutamylcyclotransferase family protein [Pyrinomonadaceae bacterium]